MLYQKRVVCSKIFMCVIITITGSVSAHLVTLGWAYERLFSLPQGKVPGKDGNNLSYIGLQRPLLLVVFHVQRVCHTTNTSHALISVTMATRLFDSGVVVFTIVW